MTVRDKRSEEPGGLLPNIEYATDLMRAFGGALLFALPLLMTMEMWELGFYMGRLRLVTFLALNVIVLFGLSYFAGFRRAFSFKEEALDTFAAFGVGAIASAALLAVLGLLTWNMSPDEIIGKIAVQTVPASIGAMAARKQLGDSEDEGNKGGYVGQLFLMLAGALFLALNVAPTEEMILIAFRMTPWHGLTLVVLSIVVLHAFVYSLDFSGQEDLPGDDGFWSTFVRYSLAGYGIALIVSLYALWTFGRTDGAAVTQIAMMVAVLGFPAAIGAAVARLVV